MKRYFAPTGMILLLCSLAWAQESTGDRVVVPGRSSARPRVVDVALTNGSITVKTHNSQDVIVETRDHRSENAPPERTVDGLKRIDILTGGLNVEEEDNQINVRMRGLPHDGVMITVPPETSLRLKSTNGSISAEGVHGEIDASTLNGRVNLTNVSGTVVTDSHNGAVKVVMDRVDPGKPISFSSFNGDIDVTLPADFKGNVKLRANRGEIYSDFEMKLTPGNITEKSDSPNGRYRVRVERTMTGTINGGGTEASFSTFNGKILIRKK